MGTQKVPKLIFTMAFPAIISMLIQAMYNIVDSFYVSNYSADAFTAISFVFPIQMIIIAVGVGTGVGVNSLIARRLGEKRIEDAKNVAIHGILLAILSGFVSLLVALLFTKSFYKLFDMSPTTYEMSSTYTYIVLGCSVFCFISIVIEKIFQGTGNMIYPMIFNLLGAIINIILDPILIFGQLGFPEMGITGAAVATIIGQFSAMALAIFFYLGKKNILKLSINSFSFQRSYIIDIYRVGFPAIVMQSVSSILTACLNSILANFSEDAVAVLGIYFKLQSFVFMPVFGLMQGFLPVIGYNYGAQNPARIKQAFIVTLSATFGIMAFGVALFNIAPGALVSIFQPSPQRYEMGITALRIISWSFFGAAFGIVISTALQGIGYGFASLITSLVRQLVLILPLAYFLSRIYGVNAVWSSFIIAEYLTVIIAVILMVFISKKDPLFSNPT